MKKSLFIFAILLLLPACGGKQTQHAQTLEKTRTAFFKAVSTRNIEKVKELLAAGADVNTEDKEGTTALYIAILTEQAETAELLIDRGADPNVKDKYGMTPLHVAVHADSKIMVELLVNKGADLNATDNDSRTPLDVAVNNNSINCIPLLRKHGAKSERVPPNIVEAAKYGNIGKIKELLAAGADVDSPDSSRQTALYYAAANGYMEIVRLLIAHGATICWSSLDNEFRVAAEKGYIEIVEFLIANGADVNGRGDHYTPLHGAAEEGQDAIADILIRHGASVNPVDNFCKTPLDRACDEEMKRLLLSYGAVSGKELEQSEEQ